MNNIKRLAYLDAIKCFGILIVICGHVQFYGMGLEAYASPSSLMLYSFNMPLFFFVSGFLVFKNNALGNASELKKIGSKFLYLVIPAFVFWLFYTLKKGGNVFGFIENGLGGYWFTFTLFEMFVIYYLIISMSKSKKFLAVMLALLSILGVGYLSFFSRFDINIVDFNRLAKYFQFFTLGVFAKMYIKQYDTLMRNELIKLISFFCFFILIFLLYRITLPGLIFHFLRDIVLRYLGLYIIISAFYCNQELFNKDNVFIKLLLMIGKCSLAIYLLQYFFMPDFSAFNTWVIGLDWLSIYAISFAYTIFIVFVCMLFVEMLSNSAILKKYLLGR